MRLELVLASLAALAAAAPIEVAATDGSYSSYAPYAHYDPYPAAVDEEAARMMNGAAHLKRGADTDQAGNSAYYRYTSYTPYASYGPYSGTVDAEAERAHLGKRMEQAGNNAYSRYTSYTPYSSYSPYTAAVEAEATKADMGKRAEMMKMSGMGVNEMKMKREMMEDGMGMHEDKTGETMKMKKRNSMMGHDATMPDPTGSCETRQAKDKRDMPMMTDSMMTGTTMGMDDGAA